MPAFCPKDHGGPVSQEEALCLLKTMEKYFLEEISSRQIIPTKDSTDRLRAFDYASGAQQAISWARNLVNRLAINPQRSRDALAASAELLEQQAQELRRRAGE
jgi:hypothetical protein